MIKFPNINNEKKSILYEYRNGILVKVCPECRKPLVNFEEELCCYCGQRFIALDDLKKLEPEISTVRYIVYNKDKTKILTYKGFVEIEKMNQGNPKLFPSIAVAKQSLEETYFEGMANQCLYVKVDVSYKEITNETKNSD